MKRMLLASMLFAFTFSASAQDTTTTTTTNRRTGFTIGRTQIGAYTSASASLTRMGGDAAGFGSIKLAATINDSWAIGLVFSGLYYDKKLSALVTDGTYHLNAGYAGIYLEKFFPVTERLTLSASVTSGTGEAKYQYDREYRKAKVWYNEIIDQTVFTVFEPGVEVSYRVSEAWALGVQGSWRSTSPVRMIGTRESMLQEFNYGLSVKWQIF